MSNTNAQTLATHLLNQTLASISLLESLSIISATDAHTIRSKLPPPTGPFPSLDPPQQSTQQQPPQQDLSTSFGNLAVVPGPSSPYDSRQALPPSNQPPLPSLPPRSRPNQESRAKALWDYRGNEADDLAFRSGDIIVIDEEVNQQWFRGRVIPQGQWQPLDRSGLFPSNYVEKLSTSPSPSYYSSPPPPGPGQQSMVPFHNAGAPPFGYNDQKPMDGQGQMIMQQPQQVMQPQQMQGPPTTTIMVPEEKKHKFGKIGGQLGHAAVNGFGFGAGSAVASELVHSIF
ncbi:SH3 domain-containing protein [Naematelia encephala]|uniref:SH3 domain-containing protein n=1 Tax=Naematelia encephala TaxID=71784 RepID=A0A1Y2BEF3_9TREE|nr:SH3 domain-containing protein [Naematelia encephala]